MVSGIYSPHRGWLCGYTVPNVVLYQGQVLYWALHIKELWGIIAAELVLLVTPAILVVIQKSGWLFAAYIVERRSKSWRMLLFCTEHWREIQSLVQSQHISPSDLTNYNFDKLYYFDLSSTRLGQWLNINPSYGLYISNNLYSSLAFLLTSTASWRST